MNANRENPYMEVVASNDNVVTIGLTKRAALSRSLKRAGAASGRLAGQSLVGILHGLRWAVFMVLMWLRFVVVLVTRAVGGLGLLAVIIGAFIHPDWAILGKVAAVSFGAFLVGWVYDGLLLMLSPEPMMIDGRM